MAPVWADALSSRGLLALGPEAEAVCPWQHGIVRWLRAAHILAEQVIMIAGEQERLEKEKKKTTQDCW